MVKAVDFSAGGISDQFIAAGQKFTYAIAIVVYNDVGIIDIGIQEKTITAVYSYVIVGCRYGRNPDIGKVYIKKYRYRSVIVELIPYSYRCQAAAYGTACTRLIYRRSAVYLHKIKDQLAHLGPGYVFKRFEFPSGISGQ